MLLAVMMVVTEKVNIRVIIFITIAIIIIMTIIRMMMTLLCV